MPSGSSFDDFLTEGGLYEVATASAMKAQQLTKTAMAKCMHTSLTLTTLASAAAALGRGARIELVAPFWTSTENNATNALVFLFGEGRQLDSSKESTNGIGIEHQALAVRDGDVLRTVTPPNGVPEPGTLLLIAASLLGLGLGVAWRKRGRNTSWRR